MIFNLDDANMEYFESRTRSVGNSLLFPKNEVAPCECKPFRSCPWVRVLDKESMNGLKRLWDCRQIWPLSMLWECEQPLSTFPQCYETPYIGLYFRLHKLSAVLPDYLEIIRKDKWPYVFFWTDLVIQGGHWIKFTAVKEELFQQMLN